MNVANIIKILSTISAIVLGVAEILKQVNIYNGNKETTVEIK